MKKTLTFLTGLLLLAAGNSNARAVVVINLSGVIGSSTIEYSISGTTTVTSGSPVSLGFFQFRNLDGFTDVQDASLSPVTGGISVVNLTTSQAASHNPWQILNDQTYGDAFSILGSPTLSISAGDVIQFSGSGTLTLDALFDGLNEGSYVGSIEGGALVYSDAVTLNVVPEPSRALLSLAGIAAIGLRRRRA